MGPNMLILASAAVLLLCGAANAARILALVPVASRSHHIWNSALTVGLAKKGHQIWALSPDNLEDNIYPNLTQMVIKGTYEKLREDFTMESFVEDSPFTFLKTMWAFGINVCRYESSTQAVKDLLKMPRDFFDLIITEVVFGECMFMFLHHFGGGTRIPVVGITAFGMGPWTDVLTGARTLPSVFAFPILPYVSKMSFTERLQNTLLTGYHWNNMIREYYPEQQKIAEEAYGEPLPPLIDLASNISVILVNNHYVLNGPQAQLPGIIDVGAMQCSPAQRLPKDISSFLNEAKIGAIYFSLGSNLMSELLPKDKLEVIVATFASLGPGIRVLWKFDPKVPIGHLPSNVLLKKWLPQEDVLGHPKTLAFVSHAGLLSTQEAIYHGVPIVAVPFFADQHTNARRLVELGVAVHVDFLTLTKESFKEKILNVTINPRYAENMRKMSNLLRDQPETPLDRAIFWVEFALRQGNDGMKALRSAGFDLAWYQYFLIDVLAAVLIAIVSPLLLIYVTMKTVMNKLRGNSKSKKKKL
ncbi:UDP-glucosyltransferase 2-like [Ischnura elegans]|uniref:UDP-glucosyltransferase 2-like n=1 Tax=Ischnura elegans TaxID=197161 RepID=UPI001ED883D5|nr:UDP-glucosyltransferase 2-like [Ischnura elegans]